MGFFAGLACLLIALTLIGPFAGARPTGFGRQAARSFALIAAAVIVAFSLRPARAGGRMALRLGGVRLRAPDGRWPATAAVPAAADLIAAALALWLLLPSAPAALDLITVYAGAMALGVLTGAPGG